MCKAKGPTYSDKPRGVITHYLVTWLTNLTIRIYSHYRVLSQCGFCTGISKNALIYLALNGKLAPSYCAFTVAARSFSH